MCSIGTKHPRYIWMVIGPAGCGKSTIAQFLARKLDLPYIEGDDFHPFQNIVKMANGIPLTDEDRWGWLAILRNEAVAKITVGDADGCIVTCSCLRRRYRDVIRVAGIESEEVVVRFVYLRADEELVLGRVSMREGHYMKSGMVHSQFVTLEEPENDEVDVVTVDVSGTKSDGQWSALCKVLQYMDAEECARLE